MTPTPGTPQIGIDWNDDHFICWDCLVGDKLNLIPTPLNLVEQPFVPTGTAGESSVSTTQPFTIPDQYDGLSQGYIIYTLKDRSANAYYYSSFPVVNGHTYTASIWIAKTTDDVGTWQVGLYNSAYTQRATPVTITSVYPNFQRINFTFTASANETILFGIKSTTNNLSNTNHINILAIMAIESSSTTQGYNTGVVSDQYESLSAMQSSWQLGGGDGITLISPEGTLNATFNNASRVFSPDNSSSPLYGLFKNHHVVRARIYDSTSTPSTRWTGFISGYNPGVTFDPGLFNIQAVQGIFDLDVVVQDFAPVIAQEPGYFTFDMLKVFFPILFPMAGDKYQFLLDRSPMDYSFVSDHLGASAYTGISGWADGLVFLDTMELHFTEGKAKLRDILTKALEIDRGLFGIDRFGLPYYFNYSIGSDPSTTPATNLNIDTQANMGTYSFAKNVLNQAVITRRRGQTTTSTVELWRTRTPIIVKRSRTNKLTKSRIEAVFKKEEGSDVTVDTVLDFASGSTLTVTLLNGDTAPASFYTASITKSSGGAIIKFTNLSLVDLIINIVISGTYRNNYGDYVSTYSNTDSIAAAGLHEFSFSSELFYDDASTDATGEFIVSRYGNVEGVMDSITIKWRDNTWLDRMLALNIGGVVRVSETQTGQSSVDYIIVGERWSDISPGQATKQLLLKRLHPTFVVGQSVVSGTSLLGYGHQ